MNAEKLIHRLLSSIETPVPFTNLKRILDEFLVPQPTTTIARLVAQGRLISKDGMVTATKPINPELYQQTTRVWAVQVTEEALERGINMTGVGRTDNHFVVNGDQRVVPNCWLVNRGRGDIEGYTNRAFQANFTKCRGTT